MHNLTFCPLFEGIPAKNIPAVAERIATRIYTVPSGTMLYKEGITRPYVGFLMSGSANILRHSTHATQPTIIGTTTAGYVFGVVFYLRHLPHCPCSLITTDRTTYFTFDMTRAFNEQRIMQNLLRQLSEKILMLNRKLTITTLPRIRDRILAYLNTLPDNTIPYTRTALANYLCVNRSALGRELKALRDAGVLSLNGKTFTLH